MHRLVVVRVGVRVRVRVGVRVRDRVGRRLSLRLRRYWPRCAGAKAT